ncbi:MULTISPECIES: MarR family winged helix-turn-helix transcriptional regulator [unclassified Solwaraspora]|uniref:MarR family winged helix-turn-helix transcriptional regulator n=1 Tax=unclassified Solwaraspora TaxID=2627926 RepID=UPI00259B56B4|nr:MarR family winged helix-turn-helix transcriptional regulator [Solwaraspora sp. WMMA2056]WJK42058.1 MarR family winged helix-turn-helix transcriptional regulator [Solwaraspora sp. WMMA2056]
MATQADPLSGSDAELIALGKQFGVFHRAVHMFYQRLRFDPPLERAAYTLLVRVAGDRPARLSVLAEDMALDLSTVSRQVAALEAAGLATRTPDPTDRRASVIAPTALGQEVFTRNRAVWVNAMRELLADWTPDEMSEFKHLLTRLNETINARYGGTDPADRCPRVEEEKP